MPRLILLRQGNLAKRGARGATALVELFVGVWGFRVGGSDLPRGKRTAHGAHREGTYEIPDCSVLQHCYTGCYSSYLS
jgi:hypothetical protein